LNWEQLMCYGSFWFSNHADQVFITSSLYLMWIVHMQAVWCKCKNLYTYSHRIFKIFEVTVKLLIHVDHSPTMTLYHAVWNARLEFGCRTVGMWLTFPTTCSHGLTLSHCLCLWCVVEITLESNVQKLKEWEIV
jgi:hypothetical protein